MNNFYKGLIFATGSFILMSTALADLPPQWVWSTFDADPPTEKSVKITETYVYQETEYRIGLSVKALPKKNRKHVTAEDAFVSRMSAIQTGDYDWWLETWDEASKKLVQEKNKMAGHDKKFWLEQWKEQFSKRKIVPVRKIETGKDYVIITYRIFTADGKDASSGFELPSILKKINGKWYSTLDLRADALLIASPWVSGKTEVLSVIF